MLYPSTVAFANAVAWHLTVWLTFQIGSDHQLERCYQVMEADDRALLDDWMANWSEIIDFEVHPVITSEKALETIYAVPVDTHRQPGGHGQTTPVYAPKPRASRF